MAEELTQPEAATDKAKYLEEVQRALSEDKTLLGDVWKLDQKEQELDASEIKERLKKETSGFVYNYRHYVKAIVEDIAPSSPSLALQCARALRGFAKRHRGGLSLETRSKLLDRADNCDRSAADPAKREEEERELEDQTSTATKEGVPGIYVYTLPHYLRYPVEERSEEDKKEKKVADRTYLKVGRSEIDAEKRVKDQERITALPEPVHLMRIYTCPNSMDLKEVEEKIHGHLEAADHFRNSKRGRGSGTEWFLTHLKFLDATAELIGLKIDFRFEDSDDD